MVGHPIKAAVPGKMEEVSDLEEAAGFPKLFPVCWVDGPGWALTPTLLLNPQPRPGEAKDDT